MKQKYITSWMKDYEITANLWQIIPLKMEIDRLEKRLREIEEKLKNPDISEEERRSLEERKQIIQADLEGKRATLDLYLRK